MMLEYDAYEGRIGSIPTVVRHIFPALTRCGYTLRVTSQASQYNNIIL